MYRTLLTVLAFALCALGVAFATLHLMPNPAGHTPAATMLDTREAPAEPVGRAGAVVVDAQLAGDR